VNFGIHLPDPLLADLHAFAQTRQTNRSVPREAVREYLARHALQAWPADLERWMREPLSASRARSGLRCHPRRDELGDAQAHCPKGQRLMRYLLDTNIVSAWARKGSSALCSRWRKRHPRVRLHPGRARSALRLRARARDPGGSDDPASVRTPAEPAGSAAPKPGGAATLRVAPARSGKPIGPYDTLIAATALEHDLTLVWEGRPHVPPGNVSWVATAGARPIHSASPEAGADLIRPLISIPYPL